MRRPEHERHPLTYSEILRTIGQYIDRYYLSDVRILETDEGIILQGVVTQGDKAGERITYQVTAEDIQDLFRDAYAHRGKEDHWLGLMQNILITGGAGFIGSNFARYIINKYPDYRIVVYDKLTYAGNLDNLRDLAEKPHYAFVRGDIADAAGVETAVREHKIDTIVNFAAETHVDRSIMDADAFIRTDVYGTFVLLQAAKKFGLRFHQVGTDEVYGAVLSGSSKENDVLEPRSPYAASKAGADLLIYSYYVTHHVPVTVTRGANNIGPYQYPEKAVPLFVTNAIDNIPLPIYGDGMQMRDYQYVGDHIEGIDLVLHNGQIGETYNVGTGAEVHNIDMARMILKMLDKPESLIQHVTDRAGHDRRYSLDVTKIRGLGWEPANNFEEALDKTVKWYVENEWWWRKIKSGEYLQYYKKQYVERQVAIGG